MILDIKKTIHTKLISIMETNIPFYEETTTVLNSVLINKYRNGKDYVGWHSDNEPVFPDNSNIISVSFGQTRKFLIKEKETKNVTEFKLKSGDIMVMGGSFQQHFLHMVPRTHESDIRFNLTFRHYHS